MPAVCTNMIGAAHTCTCAPGYTTIETGDKVPAKSACGYENRKDNFLTIF